jgi:hypothetical protein
MPNEVPIEKFCALSFSCGAVFSADKLSFGRTGRKQQIPPPDSRPFPPGFPRSARQDRRRRLRIRTTSCLRSLRRYPIPEARPGERRLESLPLPVSFPKAASRSTRSKPLKDPDYHPPPSPTEVVTLTGAPGKILPHQRLLLNPPSSTKSKRFGNIAQVFQPAYESRPRAGFRQTLLTRASTASSSSFDGKPLVGSAAILWDEESAFHPLPKEMAHEFLGLRSNPNNSCESAADRTSHFRCTPESATLSFSFVTCFGGFSPNPVGRSP